jgi:hypothetical protein
MSRRQAEVSSKQLAVNKIRRRGDAATLRRGDNDFSVSPCPRVSRSLFRLELNIIHFSGFQTYQKPERFVVIELRVPGFDDQKKTIARG